MDGLRHLSPGRCWAVASGSQSGEQHRDQLDLARLALGAGQAAQLTAAQRFQVGRQLSQRVQLWRQPDGRWLDHDRRGCRLSVRHPQAAPHCGQLSVACVHCICADQVAELVSQLSQQHRARDHQRDGWCNPCGCTLQVLRDLRSGWDCDVHGSPVKVQPGCASLPAPARQVGRTRGNKSLIVKVQRLLGPLPSH